MLTTLLDIIEMILFAILDFLIFLVPLLVAVAILTLLDRKIMGSVQRRRGPNVTGFFGILQPIADGVKLLVKESILLTNARKLLFLIGPMFAFLISLIMWSLIPFACNSSNLFIFDSNLSLLFIFGLSAVNVYGIILSGWASNSIYAFLGALRASAQMISYEVAFGLCALPAVLVCKSFNLREIALAQSGGLWNIFIVSPAAIIFFISILAETNRTPFDLPEAEGELVAGFNVEYSAIFFAFFFLSEYANMILMSSIFVILFLGGWDFFGISSAIIFSTKICFVLFLFLWIRATLPRFRFDQLIQIGWKVLLPFSLGYFLFVSGNIFFVIQLVWMLVGVEKNNIITGLKTELNGIFLVAVSMGTSFLRLVDTYTTKIFNTLPDGEVSTVALVVSRQRSLFLWKFFDKLSLNLNSLTCVDKLKATSKFFDRYKLAVILNSLLFGGYIFINYFSILVSSVTSIPSFINVYASTNWLEREAWDMFGIFFTGHPYLVRILSNYGFKGFPLRKDFPLTGYKQVYFDGELNLVSSINLSLAQEMRRSENWVQ